MKFHRFPVQLAFDLKVADKCRLVEFALARRNAGGLSNAGPLAVGADKKIGSDFPAIIECELPEMVDTLRRSERCRQKLQVFAIGPGTGKTFAQFRVGKIPSECPMAEFGGSEHRFGRPQQAVGRIDDADAGQRNAQRLGVADQPGPGHVLDRRSHQGRCPPGGRGLRSDMEG